MSEKIEILYQKKLFALTSIAEKNIVGKKKGSAANRTSYDLAKDRNIKVPPIIARSELFAKDFAMLVSFFSFTPLCKEVFHV